MQMIPQSPKRQRATVIVERDDALVLVQTRQGLWLLPGGGVTRGELPIAQVGASVGFRDAREFRRAFKRWTGTTPSAMRTGP